MDINQSNSEFAAVNPDDKLSEEESVQIQNTLQLKPEVRQLAQSIDVRKQIEIIQYGKEPAEQISKFADRILQNMQTTKIEDSGELLKQLGRIMEKIDRKELEKTTDGIFGKFFKRGEKIIEKLFGKYQTIGGEIDKIYVQISQYQNEMIQSTNMLEQLYEQNYQFYLTLEKYIVAGEMKLEELKRNELPEVEARSKSGDPDASMELDSLRNGIELLEQRLYDLRMARMVALQTAPQIRMLQRGNSKLIEKINAAFVTTIPIFKNTLIQAVAAKRQKLVAESMQELDRRTNEMLLRNAAIISEQSTEVGKLSGSAGIKIETIEQCWNIIVKGMEDTKLIEEENKRLRMEGTKQLEQLLVRFKELK